MKHKINGNFQIIMLLVLGVLVLAGCARLAQAQGENVTPVSEVKVTPAPIEEPFEVIGKLYEHFDGSPETLTIVSIEETEWSDGCLGLGGPAESCIAVIVPGYRITVQTGGENLIVRTDQTGDSIRIEGEDQPGMEALPE